MAFRSLMPFGWGRTAPSRRLEDDPFLELRRDIDRLFEDFFRGTGLMRRGEGGMAISPSIDVSETDDALQVVAELPGVDEKDLDVQLSGDMLTIRGEKRSDREQKDKNYYLVERSYGSFSRSIQLPFEVDPDKVEASFDKGVLTVTLPKPAEVQRAARRIAIRGGGR